MKKETKITAPEGCEIEKVEIVDGAAVVTFREKERKLPKSWEEFCHIFPIQESEMFINDGCYIYHAKTIKSREARRVLSDRNLLPDLATAEAVLALCQLIQLRNAYNGDWVPDWGKERDIFTIEFEFANITIGRRAWCAASPLFFKSKELRDEFLRNFRPLIEKLKPLYGIKEGGEE